MSNNDVTYIAGTTVTVTGVLDGYKWIELSGCHNVVCIRAAPEKGDWVMAGDLVGQLYDWSSTNYRITVDGCISTWCKWSELRYPTKEVIDAEKRKLLHKYTSDELFAAAIAVRAAEKEKEKEQKKADKETNK